MKKFFYGCLCLAVISLQGCISWHTTERTHPAEHTSTTVVTP
jgi:hypothetical protein